jgi:hypothetical protein
MEHPGNGLFLGIVNSAPKALEIANSVGIRPDVIPVLSEFLSESEVRKASEYPTTLRRLSKKDFVRLERHGYETCKIQFTLYCGSGGFKD